MCGIAGKISEAGAVDPALIGRMCEVVTHRGPDSRGIFCDGNVGLGVQRLAVVDLETGDQPVFNEDRSVVVVFNGEIYNHHELRAELARSGHRFSTRSDTEVIVHLYEDFGDEFVSQLRGMFALALWDARESRLLLARDRIGKKPLYYAFQNNSLWFASEPKSILQDPSVPRDVDYAAVDAFLHYQYVPDAYCAFSSLSKLPPAHLLAFEGGRLTTRRYWRLSYTPKERLADEDACELIRERLLEATKVRLRSDVPLGAFLSGGVDSSAVVAAMARQVSGRLKTFTIGFPVGSFDEREYGRDVAQIFDTDHHEFVVEPDIVELLPRLAWHYGEPFADQSAIPSFYLAKLTRSHVTVALNGDGGDESFGGYRRYAGNDVARRLAWIPSRVARLGAAVLERTGTGSSQDTTRARSLRLMQAIQLDPGMRYAMWMACINRRERLALYTPSFQAQLSDDRSERVISELYEESGAPTLIERLLDVDVQSYLPGQLLVKMDIASMANSLEVRSPFLDHHFMETAARLSLSSKIANGRQKRLLKDAVREWLPGHILDRPKRGFTMPIALWLRRDLRDLPAEVLLDGRTEARGLFRSDAIQRLIAEHQRGKRDNSNKLWALIQLELWFRTYIDASPKGPVALDVAGRPTTDARSLVGVTV